MNTATATVTPIAPVSTRTPPRFNIDTIAMLVEFNASVWTARKLDRKVSEEVVAEKGARNHDAARVNKNLLAGRTELEAVTKFVAAVRVWIYENTLPWSDGGLRLLSVLKYREFDDKMRQFKRDFDARVSQFVTVYPTLVSAQALELGQLFDPKEYPSAADMAHKFAFRYNYIPVPTAGDLRVDVGNEARAEMQAHLERTITERIEAGNRDLWERLRAHLERMSDRLTTDIVDGEPKPRRIFESMLTGGLELCDILDTLNITGDTALDRAGKQLRGLLKGRTKESLREDHVQRENVKQQVDAMLGALTF